LFKYSYEWWPKIGGQQRYADHLADRYLSSLALPKVIREEELILELISKSSFGLHGGLARPYFVAKSLT